MPFPPFLMQPMSAYELANHVVVKQTSLSDVTTLSGFTIVNKFLGPAQLFAANYTKVRLTLMSALGGAALLNDTFIGLAAVSPGRAWSFNPAAFQRVTFGGANELQMQAGRQLYFSDEISLGFVMNKSRALLVAFNAAPAAVPALGRMRTLGTSYLTYTKAGVQEAGTAAKGASYVATSAQTYAVVKIEVAP